MCAPARGWLAWYEVFSQRVDLSSQQGFFIVSRFVFCQQILSADFYRQQICLLSADSVSRFLYLEVFNFVSRFLSRNFLSQKSPLCQPISLLSYFLNINLDGFKHCPVFCRNYLILFKQIIQEFSINRSFSVRKQILSEDVSCQQILYSSADFVSRFLLSADLVSVSRFYQQFFLVSRFVFCQQMSFRLSVK